MPGRRSNRHDALQSWRIPDPESVVVEVLVVDVVMPPSGGSRRAMVRWSDESSGEALRWYDDEILFTEGDFIGKTRAQLLELKFTRDQDRLSG